MKLSISIHVTKVAIFSMLRFFVIRLFAERIRISCVSANMINTEVIVKFKNNQIGKSI